MYIKIVGDNAKYQGKLERIGAHLIKVSGLIQHTTGFRLYLDNDTMVGDYSNFVHPYDNPNLGEGVYMYSDNGMEYKDATNTPTQEDDEKQKIKDVINTTVGEDIVALSEQISSINETLLPMYEVLISMQDVLMQLNSRSNDNYIPMEEAAEQPTQSVEEEQSSEDNKTPNEETVNKEQSDVNTEEETKTP